MEGDVPRIANPDLQASVDGVLLQVNPENVLGIRKVLIEEAVQLEQALKDATDAPPPPPLLGRQGQPGYGVWVGRCSDDPISGPAQVSFNRKIAEVVQNCRAYIDGLALAGEQVGAAAKLYGFTEDEIQSNFKSFSR